MMIENTNQEEIITSPEADNGINENNLLLKIWVKPKATLTYILENCPNKFIIPLMILGGITRSIDRASAQNMGDKQSTFFILMIAIIAGGMFGWLSYYFYAWLLKVTGKWLGGIAEFEDFRTVIAWSLVPSICTLLLLVPELIIFGDDIFKSELSDPNVFSTLMLMVFGLLELTLGIWTLIIFIKGVTLIQKFNIGKAILNMILPVFVILIPILLIVFVFKLLF